MRIEKIRQRAGHALVQFATERSLERQAMERSILAATAPGSAAQINQLATLTPARWFEQVMLWVGWRLQPRQLTLS